MPMKRLTLTAVKTLTDKHGLKLEKDGVTQKQYTNIATIFIDPDNMTGFLPDGLDYVPTGKNIEIIISNPENKPEKEA